jgi:YtxH-like protein
MRSRGKDSLFKILLDTGFSVLDAFRDRVTDQAESVADRAKDAYDSATGHGRKISRSITGEDHSGLGSAAALLAGFGVGVALGILFAPASGQEIRRNIGDKIQEFGGRISSRASGEPHAGTGTATD